MLYKCDRCGYETNKKNNMKRHVSRKKKMCRNYTNT